jgi:hypothetical protein
MRRAGCSGEWLAHLAFAALASLVLASAAQPLQTDDAWWHLALGRAYASSGPWLASDPLLHTAVGPPEPSAWLADFCLHALGELGGFTALRLAHALLVAAILALAWSCLRRASGSRSAASLLAGAFAALSAYRLFQLRPELLTFLATLLLYRVLLEEPGPPSRRRVALAAVLLGLWANAHSGFALGPILLASALGGLALAAALSPRAARGRDRARALRLAAALALGLLATLANPGFASPHTAWLRAGAQTPELALVLDEWARLDLLRPPVANLPPSPLAWGMVWAMVVLTVAISLRAFLRWRRGAARDAAADPALVALALAALAGILLAVRFLWLGIFPLLLLARAGAVSLRARRPKHALESLAVAGGAAALLLAGFVRLGDWPMISRGLPDSGSGWTRPYPAGKYQAEAVWLLADAGLEGRLMNEYYQGGFLGYWLAPRLRAFVNGSLNLPKEALAAHAALAERRGRGGLGFLELLDRYEVDVFLGVGRPQPPRPGRPWIYSSGHLERAPGWIPIFRDPQSAVYLRANERNRANLARVASYYAREGVPFDAERGFDPAAVIRAAPGWAFAHGLVPGGFAALEAEAAGADPARRRGALDRLASLDVALGLYEQAIGIDRRLLRSNPGANAPARRLVWSLLRLGRTAEAAEAARALRATDAISAAISATALDARAASDPDARAALLARLPVFPRAEASRVLSGLARAPARDWRRAR